MKKTGFKLFLRFWIALSSITAFIASWIVLGHTGKPVAADAIGGAISGSSAQDASQSTQQLAPLPTLAPLPSFDGGSTQVQPLPQQFTQPNLNFSQPRFRTRGS